MKLGRIFRVANFPLGINFQWDCSPLRRHISDDKGSAIGKNQG